MSDELNMTISLSGVLTKAADIIEASDESSGLDHSIRLLLEHLRIVRGQPHRLGEFFALWVDDAMPGPGEGGAGAGAGETST